LLRQYSPHDVQPDVASAHAATIRQIALCRNECLRTWRVKGSLPDRGWPMWYPGGRSADGATWLSIAFHRKNRVVCDAAVRLFLKLASWRRGWGFRET
jgi:hypothetical protein